MLLPTNLTLLCSYNVKAIIMKIRQLTTLCILSLFLSACQQDLNPKEKFGTILGAAGGAILGSNVGKGKGKIASTAVGTLLGALIGSEIGKSLDRADQIAMERSTQKALETSPSGKTLTWSNPDTGNSGTITPNNVHRNSAEQYCREYQQTVNIGNKTETAYGTACRQPDGSWKIVNR